MLALLLFRGKCGLTCYRYCHSLFFPPGCLSLLFIHRQAGLVITPLVKVHLSSSFIANSQGLPGSNISALKNKNKSQFWLYKASGEDWARLCKEYVCMQNYLPIWAPWSTTTQREVARHSATSLRHPHTNPSHTTFFAYIDSFAFSGAWLAHPFLWSVDKWHFPTHPSYKRLHVEE